MKTQSEVFKKVQHLDKRLIFAAGQAYEKKKYERFNCSDCGVPVIYHGETCGWDGAIMPPKSDEENYKLWKQS
jgi:predicted RNA-binding Zn-ribbon protein involved in translation (DUF1610 family)